jgi:hypothetical protein
MRHNVVITISSLLSILFMTFHLTEDIVRGMEPGGIKNLIGVLISACGLWSLRRRRSLGPIQSERNT